MTHCKRTLGVIGQLWAVLAVVGLLAFGFLDFMPWVPLEDSGWGAFRALVLIATFGIGVGCAFTYVNNCR